MGDVVLGVEEALALDPRSGVRRIKRRLIVRLVFPICKLQGRHVQRRCQKILLYLGLCPKLWVGGGSTVLNFW